MHDNLISLLQIRRGHFRFESGHHGDLWIDLNQLFVEPAKLAPFVKALARLLRPHTIDAVCGPMVGGAFVAQAVAAELEIEAYYAERTVTDRVDYRIPVSLRARLAAKRIAIVDDAINAGSAVSGTLADAEKCGGKIVAIAALLTLGQRAEEIASERQIALERIANFPHVNLWDPSKCPLCTGNAPLENPM